MTDENQGPNLRSALLQLLQTGFDLRYEAVQLADCY